VLPYGELLHGNLPRKELHVVSAIIFWNLVSNAAVTICPWKNIFIHFGFMQ
jgi:hypothetical protein